MNPPNVSDFAIAAEEFNALAEGGAQLKETDLWKVRDILLRLVYHITATEHLAHATDHEGVRPDDKAFARVVRRFSAFPFNYYRVVFAPHDLDAKDEPVMGMLIDDLGDIYRDLAEGLDNYRKGHVEEACFDWSHSYRSHWVRHAVNALSAIEIYRADNYMDVEPGVTPNGGPAAPVGNPNSPGGPSSVG